MRIGVNARILVSSNLEGVHRYIYETTTQMALSHPEDDFFLFFDRRVDVDFNFPANVKSIIVPWHARHPILWIWWFEVMLPLYFWYYKIDVFYSGDGYLSLRSKVPTVMVMHDLAYIHYPQHVATSSLDFYKKYVPKYLKRADMVIAVSEYVKNDIMGHVDIAVTKIKVAYNAVSAPLDVSDICLPDNIDKALGGRPYFLYIGAIHPRKNITKLIAAFNLFNSKNNDQYVLVLAGRLAWKTDEIRLAIKSSPHVIHTGIVNEDVKYKLIKDALALTYISIFEGFGIPLLEAMKMGTLVITSTVTSLPEVAGDAALLVDPEDIVHIARGMQQLVEDPDLQSDLKAKGLKRYKHFSWKSSADTIYEALIASTRVKEVTKSKIKR